MGIQIRKALASDLDAVAAIYDRVHDAQDSGQLTTGWIRGVYPTRATAQAALDRYDVPASDVMVLHALVIDPAIRGRGLGRAFLAYYEGFALSHGCCSLRIDTNARNANARAFYKKLGYWEVAAAPCTFNGIPGVDLVLLEKRIGEDA